MTARGRAASVAFLLVLGVASSLLAACGGSLNAYPDTLAAWRAGQRGPALEAAGAEYVRFRDANALTEGEVRAAVREALDVLAEQPIAPSAPGLTAPVPMDNGAPGALRDAIRADLLSGRATPVMRAIATVEHLALGRHAPDLITVVFRREPIAPDGGLLEAVPAALRSVATKRAALDALEVLSRLD